jgi:hypothetical protein
MSSSASTPAPASKRVIVTAIQLAIASIHLFHCGRHLSGSAFRYYSSYFSDVVIPFGAYFLLTLTEEQIPLFRSWIGKAAAIFALGTAAELAQYFGYYAFGVTFDPLDIAMYAAGALLGAFFDVNVFPHLVNGWTRPPGS